MRKEDRRTSYTRSAIRNTVLGLLHKKPIERISVTEVCKLAEINRSTFYLHYMDCLDVLEQEQEALCDKLISFMEANKDADTMDIIAHIYQLVREDHDTYVLIMRSGNPMRAFAKFTDYCKGKYVTGLKQHCALSDSECEMIAEYLITGSFAISLKFAEETEFDPRREEVFHTLTSGAVDALVKRYPLKK